MKQLALILALSAVLPLTVTDFTARAANATDISSRQRQFAYCLRGGPGGNMRCDFNSKASCLKSRNHGGSCIRNPRATRA